MSDEKNERPDEPDLKPILDARERQRTGNDLCYVDEKAKARAMASVSGSTNFEEMDFEVMMEMVRTANPKDLATASGDLWDAAGKIKEVGTDITTHADGVDWMGEFGGTFKGWTKGLGETIRQLGQFAEDVSLQIGVAGEGLSTVKSSLPTLDFATATAPRLDTMPEVQKVETSDAYKRAKKKEKARQEVITQMNKLASYYRVSHDALSSKEPPKFGPMPDVGFPPPPPEGIGDDPRVPGGGSQSVAAPGAPAGGAPTSGGPSGGGFNAPGPAGVPLAPSSGGVPSTSPIGSGTFSPTPIVPDSVPPVQTELNRVAPVLPTAPPVDPGPPVAPVPTTDGPPPVMPGPKPTPVPTSRSFPPGPVNPGPIGPTGRSIPPTGRFGGSPPGGPPPVGPVARPISGGPPVGRPPVTTNPPMGRPPSIVGGTPRPTGGEHGPMGRPPMGMGGAGPMGAGGSGGSGSTRRLASNPGGIVGPTRGAGIPGAARPFTPGGTGLSRGSSGQQSESRRPDYLSEDEETWTRGRDNVVPPVID